MRRYWRRIFMAFCLILLAIMPMGMTVSAQKTDGGFVLTLQELSSQCRGSVKYQIEGDIPIPLSNETDLKKYFGEVIAVRYVDARTVRLKTKNVSNPTIRIEVDRGRLGLKHVLGKDVEETSQRVTRYVTKDGAQSGYVTVVGLTVDSLDKSDQCLTIRTYNDESNEILGEKSYRLRLERVNLETSCFLAVRYYDKRGNYNQYKGDLGEWITDADWDRPVMVVAVDDCGNTYEVDWFEITTPNSFDGLRLTVKGDTMPLEFCERMKNAQPGSPVKSLWLTTNSQVRLNDGKTHPLLGIPFRVYKSAK